ncbi:hypothetical protein MIR68_007184 [Amoeboaphelidium protococcarum]|nr:hypothetical protein MIR68_007184 [Amoeboaphelidium protococcarum]
MLQSPRLPTIIIQRVASVVVDWSSPSPDTTVQSSAHVAAMGVKLEKVGFSTVALRRVEGASPSSPTLCSVALMLLAPFCMYRPAVLTVNRMSLISLTFAVPFGSDFDVSDVDDYALPQTENDNIDLESMPNGYNADLMRNAMHANHEYYNAYQEALSNPDNADLNARAMEAYSKYKKLDHVALKLDSAWKSTQEAIDKKSYEPMPVYPSHRPSWTHSSAMRKQIPVVRVPRQKSSGARSGSMAGARQSMMAF